MNEVYIFTHIPKTAGTTLRYHFQKHLLDQVEFIHFANKGNHLAKTSGRIPFEKRDLNARMKAKVILGHNVNKNTKKLVGSNKVIELIFFRDPLAWEISRYNQYANARNLKSENFLCFREWYQTEKIHSQFEWYLINYCLIQNIPNDEQQYFDLVAQNLLNYHIVGFVDSLLVHIAPIFNKLGISSVMKAENVTGKNNKVNIFNEDSTNMSFLIQSQEKEIIFFNKIKKKLTEIN